MNNKSKPEVLKLDERKPEGTNEIRQKEDDMTLGPYKPIFLFLLLLLSLKPQDDDRRE